MNIIDTKSDLAFKKVFGEKPHLLMSLLNSLLPLQNPIIEVHYLSPEIIPDLDDGKNSIVDVRCMDSNGRYFIVEMQVSRQLGFKKRVLLNTTKVYSRQVTKDKNHNLAQPVYSLNLLDHLIQQKENEWYHHYAITNRKDHDEFWEDLHIIFIEFPKWKKLNKFDLNKSQDRWLMYFTEPNLYDRLSKEEYARFKEICEALESVEARNFSPEKLYAYELYIDSIHQYQSTMTFERSAGREEGLAEGLEQGKEQGKQLGIETSLEIMGLLRENIISYEEIALKYNIDLTLVKKMKEIL